jgi:hypothetical protein
MCIYISHSSLISYSSLTNKVVLNALGVLLQSRVRESGVTQNGFVFSKDVSLSRDWDIHNPQLVYESLQICTTLFLGSLLTSKCEALNACLLLAHQIDWSTNQVHQESCP